MNKTRKIRSVTAVILAFLLSVSILGLSLLCVARLTALNPSYAERTLKKCGFGEKKQAELKTELVSYGNACNIGGDFFDGFFASTLTADFIENDAVNYYNAVYLDSKASPDSSELEKKLKPALEEYAKTMGYDDETLDEDLDVIVGEMGQIYASILSLPSEQTVHSMISRFTRICNVALLGATVFTVLTALVLLVMFKPKVHSVRHLIYAFSGATLMLLVCPMYVRIANLIGKVNIVSKAMYSFVVSFVNGVLDWSLICAAACAVITAVLAVVYLKLSKKAQ